MKIEARRTSPFCLPRAVDLLSVFAQAARQVDNASPAIDRVMMRIALFLCCREATGMGCSSRPTVRQLDYRAISGFQKLVTLEIGLPAHRNVGRVIGEALSAIPKAHRGFLPRMAKMAENSLWRDLWHAPYC
jgi:hypothetical protein